MKLLAIGYPLPNKDIDNYNPLTAPSYFDYDGLFIDPASVTSSAAALLAGDKEFEAFDGRPVLIAPTTATTVSAADQLRRRLDETRRVLEAGGTVVVMGRPNAVQFGITGFEGCDRYSWLPAPSGMAWGPPFMMPAEGRTVRVVADDHPVASPLRTFRRGTQYRLVFDDRQAPVRQGRVLATGGSGAPIAVEFEVMGGRVIFIPAFGDDTGPVRAELAQAVVDMFQALDTRAIDEEAPYWVRSQAVPGLEQAEAQVEELGAEAESAAARASAARGRHDALASHRALLWADGRRYEEAVEAALRELGFVVSRNDQQGLQLESEGRVWQVECESSREEVVEWPYVRLQRRLEAALLKDGSAPGGVIVANGFRSKDPAERGQEYSDTLRIACENYRYTLITGQALFALVQRALGGADDAALLGIRRRLVGRTGLVPLEAALGEVEEASDAGPIF
jgi:hypothetical protein